MGIKRTQGEIDDVMNEATEQMDEGSKWPGQTYEEGVESALRWLIDEEAPNPMSDD